MKFKIIKKGNKYTLRVHLDGGYELKEDKGEGR